MDLYLSYFRNAERNIGIDLEDFKQNVTVNENIYVDADELPERPEALDNPQYGLDDNNDDDEGEGEEQEMIYSFID